MTLKKLPIIWLRFKKDCSPIGARVFAILIATFFLLQAVPAGAQQSPKITEQEAQAIGIDAYLYFYPLITMDITRRQATNKKPVNTFNSALEYPPATYRRVVRVNFDTLYSTAWLDLSKEPMIITVPDTEGRYYMLQMLDMWTDTFACPGSRTTGTHAGNFLVTLPSWQGTSPAGIERINAPTPYVWVIGRTKTDGPADYKAVHKIQAGYRIVPLSQWDKAIEPIVARTDPAVDMKMPPKVQVDTMPGEQFFAYAAEIMKLQPPHLTDEPITARLKRIGFEIGQRFDFAKLDPTVREALTSAPEKAQKLMARKKPTLARVVNGWSMNTDTIGVYGDYYLKRAIIAQFGLGANVPEDAIYLDDFTDSSGKPLDGANKYSIHFDKGATPPANAFWSVTLYDSEGFPVSNPLNRFAISSWMKLRDNPGGSLDLYVQNENPGAGKEANWLPTPNGPFNLLLRLYDPKPEVLVGKWEPPPVVKIR